MDVRTQFLAEIEAFCSLTGLAETSVGSIAVKDSRVVPAIRAGHGVSLRTIERLQRFMAEEGPRRARPRPPLQAEASP